VIIEAEVVEKSLEQPDIPSSLNPLQINATIESRHCSASNVAFFNGIRHVWSSSSSWIHLSVLGVRP